MNRRTVLSTVGAGLGALTAGCLGGTVVHEVQRQVRIDPGGYWVSRLPDVGGSGAISFAVRAESRFDVFVFTDPANFDHYESFHEAGSATETPTGHPELGATAVLDEERGLFDASTTDGGARQSYDVAGESYFVVDHSRYGMGAQPGETAGALQPFVDLEVVDEQF